MKTIVCLLNDYEVRSVGCDVRKYESACLEAEVTLIKYPIIEMAPPSDLQQFHADLVARVGTLLLTEGAGNVLVHCRGGVGRAGLLACCVAMYLFRGM